MASYSGDFNAAVNRRPRHFFSVNAHIATENVLAERNITRV